MYHLSKLKVLLLVLFFTPVSRRALAQEMSMPMHHHEMTTGKNVFLTLMDSMMVKMDQAPKGESPGADFLQQMLPHHDCAIAMARYEIGHGKNAEMIQLAKSILAEQQSERQQMNLLLAKPGDTERINAAYRSAMAKAMEAMMAQLPENGSHTNTDHSFAAVMLPHHQAAMDMARVVLRFSKDKLVLAFAGQLISNEQIEIQQMSSYLKSN